MTVVLHPEMNDQSRHVQINETARNQKNLRKLHRHENPVASFEHTHVNPSIIYVTTHEQIAPINKLSRNKTPEKQPVAKFFIFVKSIILGKKQKVEDINGTGPQQKFFRMPTMGKVLNSCLLLL